MMPSSKDPPNSDLAIDLGLAEDSNVQFIMDGKNKMQNWIQKGQFLPACHLLDQETFKPDPKTINELAMFAISKKKYFMAQLIVQHSKFKLASNTIDILLEAGDKNLDLIIYSILSRSDFVSNSYMVEVEVNGVDVKVDCLAVILGNSIVRDEGEISMYIVQHRQFKPNQTFEILLEHALQAENGATFKMLINHKDSRPSPALMNHLLKCSSTRYKSQLGVFIVQHSSFEPDAHFDELLIQVAKKNLFALVAAMMSRKEWNPNVQIINDLTEAAINFGGNETGAIVLSHWKFKWTALSDYFLKRSIELGHYQVIEAFLNRNDFGLPSEYYHELLHYSLSHYHVDIPCLIIKDMKFIPGNRVIEFIDKSWECRKYNVAIELMSLENFQSKESTFSHFFDILKDEYSIKLVIEHPKFKPADQHRKYLIKYVEQGFTEVVRSWLDHPKFQPSPKFLKTLIKRAKATHQWGIESILHNRL